MSSAPSRIHQRISGNIFAEIHNYLRKKSYSVYDAPFDVRLINTKKSIDDNIIYTVVQPDICIICDPNKLDERGCVGAPDLVIEIVSKGNTKQKWKLNLNCMKKQVYSNIG